MESANTTQVGVIPFVKMEGIGNDYVYVDAVSDPGFVNRHDLPALARSVSDRHFGIGSDGLIVIANPRPGRGAEGGVRMIMFNADGSEGAMCGNGIRCVAKFAVDRGLVEPEGNDLPIDTKSGVRIVTFFKGADGLVERVRVDMGEPILDLDAIGVCRESLAGENGPGGLAVIQRRDGLRFEGTLVSMGNPHMVIRCDDVSEINLEHVGPLIDRHAAFPDRINAHFVQVDSRTRLTMRTWERGSGITLACGTGAAAVGVAAVLRGWCERMVNITLPGGDLEIEWDEQSNHVFKTGPAREVFSGSWNVNSNTVKADA